VSSRRTFLSQALATASLVASTLPIQAQSRKATLRILILGGTGNIGPYHVRAAVARGHEVSVFSRGRTHSDLPAGVERLLGDRNGDLESLRKRDWDAVIDLATYGPGWVRSLGKAIRDRTRHYTFISTISVYADPAANERTDEGSSLLEYDGTEDPYTIFEEGQYYGELKVLCEREAQEQFPGRTVVLRPGFIGGPDETHGVLSYWTARTGMSGEMLAADPTTPVQYVDVRDLADWVVRLVESRATGTYNALSSSVALKQVVDAAVSLAPKPPAVTWVSSDWLTKQKNPETWGTVLFWKLNEGYLTRIGNARALAAGLTIRPLRATLADTWAWYERLPELTRAELGTGFMKNRDSGRFEKISMPWPEYLEREKAALVAWHARGRV
jgi:2'-hydroxyisoflavone reductase